MMPVKEKNISKYVKALESPSLDSADYILLATGIISEKFGSKTDAAIEEIHSAFARYDYKKAYFIIDDVLSTFQKSEPALCNLLKEKQNIAKKNDKPEKNQTRRYFDTNLSFEIWQSQLPQKQFKSIGKLGEFINTTNSDFKVPKTVNSLQESEKVVKEIRDFGDTTNVINETIAKLRDTEGSISPTKDRGDKRPTSGPIYSMNTGIVKANSPMPLDERLSTPDQAFKNRIPDIFEIDKNKVDGYSKTNITIPFVNSVSGTTYALVAVLIHYTEKHKLDPDLEIDVNNIVNAFLSFTCKNGFHSLAEMFDVLNDKAVKDFFKGNNIKLYPLAKEPLDKAIEATTQYSITTNLHKLANNELVKKVSENKKQNSVEQPSSGIKL